MEGYDRGNAPAMRAQTASPSLAGADAKPGMIVSATQQLHHLRERIGRLTDEAMGLRSRLMGDLPPPSNDPRAPGIASVRPDLHELEAAIASAHIMLEALQEHIRALHRL